MPNKDFLILYPCSQQLFIDLYPCFQQVIIFSNKEQQASLMRRIAFDLA